MAYWIVVGSEENMRIAEARGFGIFGFKSTRSGQVSKMRPGDKLVFYLTKIMKFGGLAEVTSGYFEDHSKVFKRENRPGEDYQAAEKVVWPHPPPRPKKKIESGGHPQAPVKGALPLCTPRFSAPCQP